ncbi:mini zinc finger protein 1 [Brachypodium distachyon]|uniref:ZF-HD dimerization-type domain-containing protein n=1 Tax=Brachypodium distachyon TaxID=15368 RepID=I1IUV5_BRADI|nr:mini zinc finger protein 1 [Brachypodium distachyon]KQJ92483.1 hypothetical protein BRADI_4g43960v3 [Brachypodium distachyon]|eukprot:XP_010238788.1 mini zinc finger protein 1 [Brachypodium distachyon]
MGPKGQANGNSTAAASEAEMNKQADQDGSGNKVVVQYRECQRNHAAGIGGYAVDGCREFLACLPPQDLLCAACGCHRSFHKRELAAAHSDSDFDAHASSFAAAGR